MGPGTDGGGMRTGGRVDEQNSKWPKKSIWPWGSGVWNTHPADRGEQELESGKTRTW